MDSLSEGTWDLLIAGTSLPQALLALSLSRSGLKILHVDKNKYYGGSDAGLSLDEAERWATEHADNDGSFINARTARLKSTANSLKDSRYYTLSLKPQIIYAQSAFLPSLVSSQVHTQLEFLAVGTWWIHKDGKLQKIPSTREDVFADDSLSRRDKIGLMKFLRHVLQDGEEGEETENDSTDDHTSMLDVLTSRFKITPALQTAISALALAPSTPNDVEFGTAAGRIRRHMKSMGYFGPGFGAVMPKYAGNAEIAQVACRAGAVGGATYILGHGLATVHTPTDAEVRVDLTDGTQVKTKVLVGSFDDLPLNTVRQLENGTPSLVEHGHSISIISSPLSHLFAQTSDNGPVPAVAIVLMNEEGDEPLPPIYLQVHSADTGECPSDQCVIYVSTMSAQNDSSTEARLTAAVRKFIQSSEHTTSSEDDSPPPPQILWTMLYTSRSSPIGGTQDEMFAHDRSGRVLAFQPQSQDIAFDDRILDNVKAIWRRILTDPVADELDFMRFEQREQQDEDNEVQ